MLHFIPIKALQVLQTHSPSPTCVITCYQSIDDIDTSEWEQVVGNSNFFLKRPFLQAMEHSLQDGFLETRYAVAHDEIGKAVAVAFFQIIDIKGSQNLRFKTDEAKGEDNDGHPNPNQGKQNKGKCKATQSLWRHLDPITYRAKKLLTEKVNCLEFRLLVCGNVFVTGEHGFCFCSNSIGKEQAFDLLEKMTISIVREEALKGKTLSLTLIKDFGKDALSSARHLAKHNFHEVKALPDLVLTMRPEWKVYDNYLQSFSSKYRVRAKGYHKKAAKLQRKYLSADEIVEQMPILYPLYRRVIEHADINLAYASPQYFSIMKQYLGDDFAFWAYYLDEQPVGFISIINAKTHTEAHLTGYDDTLNRQHAIYPNILYDIVAQGIAWQTPEIWFGRTASEIKSTLGAEGIHLNAFVRHRHCLTNNVIAQVVNSLRQDEWIPRHPFKEQEGKELTPINTTTSERETKLD